MYATAAELALTSLLTYNVFGGTLNLAQSQSHVITY